MPGWATEARTPHEVLAQWDAWIRSGAKTLADMTDELGLVSKQAAFNRLRRWREKRRPGAEVEALPERVEPEDRDALLSRLVDILSATQEVLSDLDDRQPVVTVSLEGSAPYMPVFFSDTHIGGSGVDHRQMQEDMELVRDTEGTCAFHIGDHVDNFSPRVIPAGMMEQLANPELQWEVAEMYLRRHLTPNKLKAGIGGNHDDFSGAVGLTPCKAMYRRLGVPFLGPGGRVWVKLGNETYKFELRHDFPFKSSLNTTNSQRRLGEMVQGADVVALGHLHFPDMQFAWRGGINQVWLRASTYKQHDAWADSKNLTLAYAPPPMDMPGVIIWPDQHKVLPFRRFQDGLPLLRFLRSGGAA